jgi:hypothetical protein
MADNLLKNLTRKLKSENVEKYQHVFHLMKLLGAVIKHPTGALPARFRNDFILFQAQNLREKEVLGYMMKDLQARYA